MKTFKDQVAIITGAASGIGQAIANRLAKEGVRLALLDVNAEKLREIRSEIQVETRSYVVDITDEPHIRKTVEEINKAMGCPHILVNSAGITGVTNIKSHETETADVQNVFGVNYYGSYYTSKYAIPYMLAQRYGRVLHIASIAGKEGNAGMLAYSSSKAGVIAMAKVQGKEYAETGITVNALAPAVIRTNLVDAMPDEQVSYMTDKIPAKRCGTLEEVANLATYIVSPMNSFTTGFTFDLSGGRATY